MKRAMPKQPRKGADFASVVDARMREAAYLLRGHGGRTGRVMRDERGEAVGRFGGYGGAVPELEGIAAPGRMVAAIERKRGPIYERIKWEIERWAMKHFPQFGPARRGTVAGPHRGLRTCPTCGIAHSATAHRAHGPGAFLRRGSPVRDLDESVGELRRPAAAAPDWVLDNPRGRGRLIYGEVLRIYARRTNPHICSARCRAAGHVYKHTFVGRDKPAIYGEPGHNALRIRR